MLVVWSHSLESIIPTCNDFEERLIKLLWRSRPNGSSLLSPSIGGSVGGHGSLRDSSSYSHANLQVRVNLLFYVLTYSLTLPSHHA